MCQPDNDPRADYREAVQPQLSYDGLAADGKPIHKRRKAKRVQKQDIANLKQDLDIVSSARRVYPLETVRMYEFWVYLGCRFLGVPLELTSGAGVKGWREILEDIQFFIFGELGRTWARWVS